MTPESLFFLRPEEPIHKRYEALRSFYVEGMTAREVSAKFGYTVSTVYALARDFKILLGSEQPSSSFFIQPQLGRKQKSLDGSTGQLIVELRKKYLSVSEIKAILDSVGEEVSEKYIYNLLVREGFTRLPRRSNQAKTETRATVKLEAAKSELLALEPEEFTTESSIGSLCLLPYIQELGIDRLIEESEYPETKSIPKLNAILSFVALKLSNIRRYTADDLWCMDRGLGLFAGLNVLPKAAWYTSYSHRVTRNTNLNFLKSLAQIWIEKGFLSDTANLDFTTIPYWGEDDSHLENNWSGTRRKALSSMLAIFAHDPQSGIITYGDTSVRHQNKDQVVLEFLDFYKDSGGEELKYLVFDSKFTTYQNLANLDDAGIKFLTIRRRGKKIVERINAIPDSEKRKVRVPAGDGQKRLLNVLDEIVFLKDYGDTIRQISISGSRKVKPALIITNDFDLSVKEVVRKYARRWIVEKTISEQIEFFHLNKISSSMVIKVDFDLTMSILTHNLYRIFASDLEGYSSCTPQTLYQKFIHNSGKVTITNDKIIVTMKKKRHLPVILTSIQRFQDRPIRWLAEKKLVFQGASIS